MKRASNRGGDSDADDLRELEGLCVVTIQMPSDLDSFRDSQLWIVILEWSKGLTYLGYFNNPQSLHTICKEETIMELVYVTTVSWSLLVTVPSLLLVCDAYFNRNAPPLGI